jgi:2-amino-4-hydroxy-6-hydroxymethyldihydropteridine diphosphokinase
VTGAIAPAAEVRVFLAMGGNLGDVLGAFRRVLAALPARGVRVGRVSHAYRTRAMVLHLGDEPGPDYWNAVSEAHTALAPRALLALCQELEDDEGRERVRKWADRTLDLDILVYGDRVTEEPDLTLPHPGLAKRLFVLQPFADVDPDFPIPGLSQTVGQLLARFPDRNAGIEYVMRGWL